MSFFKKFFVKGVKYDTADSGGGEPMSDYVNNIVGDNPQQGDLSNDKQDKGEVPEENTSKEQPEIPEDLSKLLGDLGITNIDEEVLKSLIKPEPNNTNNTPNNETSKKTDESEISDIEELKKMVLEQKREQERQAKMQQNFAKYMSTNPNFAKIVKEQPELIQQVEQMFGGSVDYTHPATPHLIYNAILGMRAQELVKVAFEKGREYALTKNGAVSGGGRVGGGGRDIRSEGGKQDRDNPYANLQKGANPSEWV